MVSYACRLLFPKYFSQTWRYLPLDFKRWKQFRQNNASELRRCFFLVFFVLGFCEPLIVVLRCLGRVVLRQSQVFCFEWACLAMLKVSLNFDSHSPHLWVLCVLVGLLYLWWQVTVGSGPPVTMVRTILERTGTRGLATNAINIDDTGDKYHLWER